MDPTAARASWKSSRSRKSSETRRSRRSQDDSPEQRRYARRADAGPSRPSGKERGMRRAVRHVAAVLLAASLSAGTAEARSITWVRAEDALTLDPHAVNDGPTQALHH